jgi:hypothetical protein
MGCRAGLDTDVTMKRMRMHYGCSDPVLRHLFPLAVCSGHPKRQRTSSMLLAVRDVELLLRLDSGMRSDVR